MNEEYNKNNEQYNKNNENMIKNNPLTKYIEENPKEKLNIRYPALKPINLSVLKINEISNNIPLSNSRLPLIKPNFNGGKASTSNDSDHTSRQNILKYNCLTLESSGNNNLKTLNNNTYSSIYLNQNHNLLFKSNGDYKSQLNIIKDENEKIVKNIHYRNLEAIKKLVEKRKQKIESKIDISNRIPKTPMERLVLFKKSLINNGIALIQHKKLEPLNSNEPKPLDDNIIYSYQIIHEGNSSEVIEECLKRRGHWKKFNSEELHNSISQKNGNISEKKINTNEMNFPNFLWSHCSNRIDFDIFNRGRQNDIKKMTNHFEFHKEISNKLNLFLNLMDFCEKQNYDLFSIIPVTFPIKYESKFYLLQISSFNYIFNNIEKYISDSHLDCKYKNLFEIETKSKIGHRTSFHIPKNHYCGRNLWLVKAIDLNRGRCIKISDNTKEIENIIKNFYRGVKKDFDKEEKKEIKIKEDNKLELPKVIINKNLENIITKANSSNDLSNQKCIPKKLNMKAKDNIKLNHSSKKDSRSPRSLTREKILNIYKNYKLYSNDPKTYQNSSVIIQKYIEKPLCYKGRKCDMRLWVLLTWDFNVYLFKEGHFKASSVHFDINSQDSYIHLTNYSVQKYNHDFAKYEMGNEISFLDFELSVNNTINIRKDLFPKLKQIILYTMKCAKNKINRRDRRLCFEIFGYDFMFDIDYKPYLLEINTNPGLEISSPLIQILIPRLIDDAFKLTIDKVFLLSPNNLSNLKKNPLKVGGYEDDENMWELIGNALN